MNIEKNLQTLSKSEEEATTGGFIPLLILGALLLAGSRYNGTNAQSNNNSSQVNVNCTHCSVSFTPVK